MKVKWKQNFPANWRVVGICLSVFDLALGEKEIYLNWDWIIKKCHPSLRKRELEDNFTQIFASNMSCESLANMAVTVSHCCHRAM